MNFELKQCRLLVTGGAGFIGSALCETFLAQDNEVVCLDNLLTGHRENIEPFLFNPRFTFIEGDIRDPETCKKACDGIDYVFHEAALGSVPRSIENPLRTNEINITGTLNMLIASRDAKVKRFVYASSSSVYGSSKILPKVEEETGEPLSPYAVTKVVNEKYARVFEDIYGLETAGLRYFNVFGRRQDPHGAYAAVIPRWASQLIKHERPVINGDGSYSRDFTYIDNVVHANEMAATASRQSAVGSRQSAVSSQRSAVSGQQSAVSGQQSAVSGQQSAVSGQQSAVSGQQSAVSGQQSELPTANCQLPTIFNIAYGANTNLNELFSILRDNLSRFDPEIARIEPIYGSVRPGDIPHSHASIEKAKKYLGYNPQFDARKGFELACKWYYQHLR